MKDDRFEASGEVSASMHSVEAEQQLLGTAMLDASVVDRVAGLISPDDFYEPLHGLIWKICLARVNRGQEISPTLLKSELDGQPALEELGGPPYLARMAGAAFNAQFAPDYAREIGEFSARRRLSEAVGQAQSRLKEGASSSEALAALQIAMETLPAGSDGPASVSAMRAMTEAVEAAHQIRSGVRTNLATGIRALDSVIGGLEPGDMCLIGGATSMGKTSVALEIANNVATSGGKSVAFVSLEMSEAQLMTRMASMRARVPYTALRDPGKMDDKDFEGWLEGASSAAQAALRIIPKHVRDIPAIASAVRQCDREVGPDAPVSLVVIDYLQLIRMKGTSRYDKMSEISTQTKALAKQLGVPVIGLVQIDRNIGDREDTRPQLSDIKETGQFENDCDQAIFCHREDHWMIRKGPKPDKTGKITPDAQLDWEADLAACRNQMELIVRKNRHGGLAVAKVGFHAETNRFWDLQKQREELEF